MLGFSLPPANAGGTVTTIHHHHHIYGTSSSSTAPSNSRAALSSGDAGNAGGQGGLPMQSITSQHDSPGDGSNHPASAPSTRSGKQSLGAMMLAQSAQGIAQPSMQAFLDLKQGQNEDAGLDHAELERDQLLGENLCLKARLRNILQYMERSATTPSMTHARKLLPVLQEMDLPPVSYHELLTEQLRKNSAPISIIKKKLLSFYLPTLDAPGQKRLKEDLRAAYRAESEEFAVQKELQRLNKSLTAKTRKTEQSEKLIRAAAGENQQLLSGKQHLEEELMEQKEAASENKVQSERLRQQFLLVNATVTKFLKTLNSIPIAKFGNEERAVQSMKHTLCKLAKESSRLQIQLESTLKEEKLYEVKYKALSLETQRTWRSGMNRVPPSTESAAESAALYEALELAEDQALTGLPDPQHHDPVWRLISTDARLASEPASHKNAKAIEFLTRLTHNCGQEPVDIFNEMYLDEKSEERYRAIKYLAREFVLHHRKGSMMTQLMKDLQAMNKFRDQDVALSSINLVICRVLECDFARCWYINHAKGQAWVTAETKTGTKIVTKDLNDGSYVSQAFKLQASVNIPDAYADSKFNREMDRLTGYRTKAVLCAPIRTQGKVRAVIEAINKISTSSSCFDPFDEFLLHVIGYSTVDVVNKCQKHRANVQTSLRKNILLEAAEDLFQKCHSVKDLFRVLKDRMLQMFQANEIRIVLVHQTKQNQASSLQRIDVDLHGGLITRDFGMVGLCGETVGDRKFQVFEKPRRSCGRRFHHGVDLDGEGKVFFWPLFYQGMPSVVMMFSLPVLEADELTFNANSSIHVHALEKLFAMAMFFLEKWFPSSARLAFSDKQKNVRFKNYVEFQKLMQPTMWKEEVETYAVCMIQRWFRRTRIKYAIFQIAKERIAAAKFIQAQWASKRAKATGSSYREGVRREYTFCFQTGDWTSKKWERSKAFIKKASLMLNAFGSSAKAVEEDVGENTSGDNSQAGEGRGNETAQKSGEEGQAEGARGEAIEVGGDSAASDAEAQG
ncbi:unnamed protein product [Amoebophrya sp. A25]|nr:unnamed protein product [Amoebophrya sp. A25]|eukprot:GSA25T00025586001.1